jgi:hypothetical protein
MSTSLYDASVGTFIQIVGAVDKFMAKGADHCEENGISLDEIVATTLRDDMLPFHFQIVCVAAHSTNAVKAVMSGEAGPPTGFDDTDYAGLQGYVANALTELQAVDAAALNDRSGQPVVFKMGANELPFSAENYMLSFSLPNFYFHATTAYDILRSKGVPIGKMDFLGQMRMGA